MRRARWDPATHRTHDRPARLDNLALVPASLLPQRATYQRLANQLPDGAVLVVLPDNDSPERRTLQEAAARLRAKGHATATLSVADVIAHSPRGRTPRAVSESAPPSPTQPVGTDSADVEDAALVAPDAAPPTAELGAVPPFTRELRLLRIDGSAAPARVEVLQWRPTLWGSTALVRASGTLGTAPRVRTLLEAAAPGPSDALTARIRRRLQAGYRIVDWQ